jgi:hypothetical protein
MRNFKQRLAKLEGARQRGKGVRVSASEVRNIRAKLCRKLGVEPPETPCSAVFMTYGDHSKQKSMRTKLLAFLTPRAQSLETHVRRECPR